MKKLFLSLLMLISLSFVFAQDKPAKEPVEKDYSEHLNAIKVRPLGPLFGNYEVSYERGGLMGGNKAIEGSIAYLGKSLIGNSLYPKGYQHNGFRVRLGGKLYFGNQEFKIAGMRRTHAMYGKYIKIEVNGSAQNTLYTNATTNFSQNHTQMQILFIGGKQYVADEFCFDIFGGLGYSLNTYSGSSSETSSALNTLANIFPIGIDVGFKMGYMFKTKK